MNVLAPIMGCWGDPPNPSPRELALVLQFPELDIKFGTFDDPGPGYGPIAPVKSSVARASPAVALVPPAVARAHSAVAGPGPSSVSGRDAIRFALNAMAGPSNSASFLDYAVIDPVSFMDHGSADYQLDRYAGISDEEDDFHGYMKKPILDGREVECVSVFFLFFFFCESRQEY